MNQPPKVKVAFIGAGYMTSEHLKAFNALSDVQTVGIHTRNRERAEILARSCPSLSIYETIDSLFLDTQPDLVVISVPELACAEVCSKAFKYPWTLLIEKPVGYNLTQARQIEAEASLHQAKAFVALNRRYYDSTQRLLSLLSKSTSRRIVSILDQEDANTAKAGQPSLVVQNWMFANSIHLIDYFSLLCRGSLSKLK